MYRTTNNPFVEKVSKAKTFLLVEKQQEAEQERSLKEKREKEFQQILMLLKEINEAIAPLKIIWCEDHDMTCLCPEWEEEFKQKRCKIDYGVHANHHFRLYNFYYSNEKLPLMVETLEFAKKLEQCSALDKEKYFQDYFKRDRIIAKRLAVTAALILILIIWILI